MTDRQQAELHAVILLVGAVVASDGWYQLALSIVALLNLAVAFVLRRRDEIRSRGEKGSE